MLWLAHRSLWRDVRIPFSTHVDTTVWVAEQFLEISAHTQHGKPSKGEYDRNPSGKSFICAGRLISENRVIMEGYPTVPTGGAEESVISTAKYGKYTCDWTTVVSGMAHSLRG